MLLIFMLLKLSISINLHGNKLYNGVLMYISSQTSHNQWFSSFNVHQKYLTVLFWFFTHRLLGLTITDLREAENLHLTSSQVLLVLLLR